MSAHPNPWAARFEPLLDKTILKQRATVTVLPLEGLSSMPTELACACLESALKSVFYPTIQCLDILHRLAGNAYAHCMVSYPDSKGFMTGVYTKHAPLPEFSCPICLTGLAGTGKSELMKTVLRIQVSEKELIIDPNHSPFMLKGPWCVTVQARSSPKDVLRALAQSDGMPSELIDRCRKLAFRDGIPYVMADEFQFATGSGSANARVTQMLLSLGYIGLPFLYAANFSLVSRLKKRPEEDQHRLLSDPIVLLPDSPLSDDWIMFLKTLQEVAPKILTFDVKKNAAALHSYSAGLKRLIVKLIVLAYRTEHPCGGTVSLSAIHRAYHSLGFATHREEVEILSTQVIQNRPNKNRKDLWCPIPLPVNATLAFTKSATDERNKRVAEEELKSSLNSDERQALEAIQWSINKSKKQPGEVVPIRKKAALTADDLKKNANWFKDQI